MIMFLVLVVAYWGVPTQFVKNIFFPSNPPTNLQNNNYPPTNALPTSASFLPSAKTIYLFIYLFILCLYLTKLTNLQFVKKDKRD